VNNRNRTLKLTDERPYFKPFSYPWAYEAFKQSEQMHWLWSEIPMVDDVKDWKTKLNEDEKTFLTHLYRFFTQGDIDVAGAYVKNYLPIFPQPEVRMMLLSFAAREGIHVAAYSHLIETLGMPDVMYNEFLKYDAMKAKHNFIEEFTKRDGSTIAQQIAVFSAFTEGMQLFSSFAMLMNFSRFGKMKGMGQVIQWSIADETLHCNSMIKLFRQFIKENRDIWTDSLKKEIYDAARTMLKLEHDFIDLAFGMSEHEGLTKEDMKLYAMFMADRNLIKLGMKSEFNVRKNPLPWMDSMLGERHTNFFEQKVTDYSKGALSGSWGDVWGGYTTINKETI
jgi:ribonucleoside-diphosphate reductase beta chain